MWLGKVKEQKLRAWCGLPPGEEDQELEKMGEEPRSETQSGISVAEDNENTEKSGPGKETVFRVDNSDPRPRG